MLSHRQLADVIRVLAMDGVQQARSGHPGMAMGMADIAEVLWRDFLRHNPANPHWANRDRFVLSNGHGSMLIYTLLHLSGYDLSLEELKNFRQLHSKTPGHPEYGDTPGIETTTGPLGQGIANAVGMALAEKVLAAQFNRADFNIVDHFTYAFLGDGCLMEGISHEVCSLAGTWELGKLIAFWDDNKISIDGDVRGWFTDDTANRFAAYHWHVIRDVDGHDREAVKKAIAEARSVTDKPSLICCKTTIGYGSPNKSGKASSHGEPLGEDETKLVRRELDWPYEPFNIPEEYYQQWDATTVGEQHEEVWDTLFSQYTQQYPELADELARRLAGDFPNDFAQQLETFVAAQIDNNAGKATRKSSLACIEFFNEHLPELLGGSADLAGSNCTKGKNSHAISPDDFMGNYIHYGVREFGMAAIMNGVAAHGGFIPYGGTYLVFSDYARNALRMSALMQQRVVYILTHDSIGLGEDGPTHQPIEQLSSLRLMPNMSVWRPADAVETAVAWQTALEKQTGPTSICLTRQGVVDVAHEATDIAAIKRGGYILKDCAGTPELILISTGSELGLTLEAATELTAKGYAVRVVSMPCTNIFDTQDEDYKQTILPDMVNKRVAVEAGSPDIWYKYIGLQGEIVSMNSFGASAPAKVLFEHFGFTVANIVAAALPLLNIN